MLPAQAIIEAIGRTVAQAFPDFRDRVFLNRTVALDEAENDLTSITIRQASDDPYDDASTFDLIGMSLSVQIVFTDSDNDEAALVKRLNSFRLRLHRTMMTRGVLGYPWVMGVAMLGADEPASSNSASVISKELTTKWGVLYTMARFNPDV